MGWKKGEKRPPPAPIIPADKKILYRELARGIRSQLSTAFCISQEDRRTLDPGVLRAAADTMDMFCRYMDDMPCDTDMIRSLIARACRHQTNFAIYAAHMEMEGHIKPQAMILADAARRESQMATQLLKSAYDLALRLVKDKKQRELTVPGYVQAERDEEIEDAAEDSATDVP